MGYIGMLILGILISILGILNIKGDIRMIHWYNRRKVTEEDVPKFGKAMGIGTLIIGASLIVGAVVAFWNEVIIVFIIIPAVVVGLGFILYALFKYNRGIF